MRKALYVLIGLVAFVPVATVLAGQVIVPHDRSGAVIINQGEYDDLYATGGSVLVGSDIRGDLFAAGGELTLGGTVGQDLFAAGGTINVTKAVTGDARLAGGSISITAPVDEDLLVAGGSVNVAESAPIGGDVRLAGGSIILNNNIKGSVNIQGGEVYINGTIGGPVDITSEKLTFGPRSTITGPVTYKGPQQAVVESGAVVPEINFTVRAEQRNKGPFTPAFFTAGLFVMFVAKLLAALLFYKFFGRTAETVATTAYTKPWQSLGIGFVGMIVVPISVFILLITVFGFYIAMIVGLWFAVAMLLTGIMTAIFIGASVFKWIQRAKELQFSWWSLVAGIVVLGALKLIPIVGWLVLLILFLMTFGGVLQTIKSQIMTIHMKK